MSREKTISVLLERAGKIVSADLPIRSEFRDREKEQRYWEVEGFARVSCGGTHLRRTGEVGQIAFSKTTSGKEKSASKSRLFRRQQPPGSVALRWECFVFLV
jgi:Ser-tRNA(Ala) deacylase AlaX